ncbi:hypothetical protein TIFTF001_042496 [Ficus carica]|uniref:Uncharacterized protein n=1 Tax=Ficus carica TaxID=3494 RepID=A0AA88DFH3_FICCA|nr:hypothetical protein TIFTF001_042496 [Ficus carica]
MAIWAGRECGRLGGTNGYFIADYYGMDDRDIEEVEIFRMEAGDNVLEIRRRSFNTPIPPSPMLAPSRK